MLHLALLTVLTISATPARGAATDRFTVLEHSTEYNNALADKQLAEGNAARKADPEMISRGLDKAIDAGFQQWDEQINGPSVESEIASVLHGVDSATGLLMTLAFAVFFYSMGKRKGARSSSLIPTGEPRPTVRLNAR